MLNKNELNYINQKLSIIMNKPFRYIGRASGMAWLGFGKKKVIKNLHGQERLLAQYALHLQCAFRITNTNETILANLDMFEPNNQTEWSENFRWDILGANLYDEKSKVLTEKWENNDVMVADIQTTCLGDLKLTLSNGYTIEIFNNLSAHEEIWRFFETGCNEPHLIITGQGMES